MAIVLNNQTPLDLDHPHLNSPPLAAADVAEFLSKLQGNILKSHGRDHLEIHFIQLTAAATAGSFRALLRALAPLVTTAAEQAAQTIRFKSGGRPEPFVSLGLTNAGFARLGLTFLSEMCWLGDPLFWSAINPGPNAEPVFQDLAEPIGLVLLIAHGETSGAGDHWRNEILPIITGVAGWHEPFPVEKGKVLRARRKLGGVGPPTPVPVEHFGFVDGISQPRILATDPFFAPWDSFRPLSQVLIEDAKFGGPNAFGSYFTLQKLEQNPLAFRTAARATGHEEAHYASIMGRWRDGRPLVPTPPGELNRFDYSPPGGAVCPHHAHILRANPRDSTLPTPEPKRVIFARRSITYGSRDLDLDGLLDETVEPPAGGVGLLFMGCMGSIRFQFEIMTSWFKGGNIPVAGTVTDDAVIHGRGLAGVPFVKQLGGLHFFAPSVATLRNI